MESPPSPEINSQTSESPAPEVLTARADDGTPAETPAPEANPAGGAAKPPRRRTYRPSHRATFIGVAVVVLILVVNVAIFYFILKTQSKNNNQAANNQVTINPGVLDKLGVNTSSLGNSGVQLIVGPNAQFKGKVTIAGETDISGQLKLNNKLTASDAALTQLEAGNTSLSQLSVNGTTTLSGLNLRNNLVVTGTTQLQQAVTIGQLLTVNNNLTVVGSLAVGGSLSVSSFSARSLVSTSTLTIGGHVITGGSTPGVGPGGAALGSNGTVSISGNDSAGTIDINIGAGAIGGGLVNVAFRTQYASAPRVVISPVGVAGEFYLFNLSVAGFSVGVGSGLPPGGYSIEYIVEQ